VLSLKDQTCLYLWQQICFYDHQQFKTLRAFGGSLVVSFGIAAAVHKTCKETGLDHVKPIQVLGTWNIFFPTSNWDSKESKGTQTVNLVILVEQAGDAGIQMT
jgi:hypothetical protein